MRQKRYPYKKLTTTAKVSAGGPCTTVTLSTINSLLFFDIRDYAHLVFDFTGYASQAQDSSGFKAELTGLKLLRSELDVPKKPEDKVTKVQKVKWITLIEGWASKYTAANTGFGIVIAILLVAIIAVCFLF